MADRQIDELSFATDISDATTFAANNNAATYEAQQVSVGQIATFMGARADAVHNLGDLHYNKSNLAIDNPGAVPGWTGEYVTNANNVYPDLYTWLKTSHPELCITRSAYDAAITADGECRYFVVDEESGSIRFPKYTYTAPDYPWIYCFNAAVPQTTTQGAEYTTSLISKVSKAGDTMTGELKVPTPSESENSTVVPTTAWVKKFLNDKLGKVYFSQSSLASDNSGALPLFTGETITSANTIYPDFYNWVLAHTELQCTSAEYESALSTYGECPKYVIGGGSLRLPKLSNYIKAANTSEGITQKEAGLPNITGYASPRKDGYEGAGVSSGAFWLTPDTETAGHQGSERSSGTRINFDASRSNPIYGNSNTVTPSHTTLYPWVVAYAAAIPASEAQAAEFQQGLSGKADTNLGNLSATGKNILSASSLPTYINKTQITPGSSGSLYTAPGNGWFVAQGGGGWVILQNQQTDITMKGEVQANVLAPRAFVPCLKGQKVFIYYDGSISWIYFLLSKGAE